MNEFLSIEHSGMSMHTMVDMQSAPFFNKVVKYHNLINMWDIFNAFGRYRT